MLERFVSRMGKVIISGKQLCSLHTKSLKKSPNKENILIEEGSIAKYYHQYGICIFKPIIDRLVITYNLEDFSEDKREELIKYITVSFPQDGINDEAYKSVPKYLQGKYQFKAYKYNIWLKYKDQKKYILIQAVPLSPKAPFMRFDFYPAKLGKEGMEYFKKKLNEDFSLPDSQVYFDRIAEHEHAIQRIDIAVDIAGVNVDDLSLDMLKGGEVYAAKSQVFVGLNGRNESIYPGFKNGKSNDLYVYNKKQQQIDNNEKPTLGNINLTRIERRVKKTKHSLYSIHKMQNHFKKINVRFIDYEPLKNKPYWHSMFIKIAKDTGLEKALGYIPESEHSKYIESYSACFIDIWKPESLWDMLPSVIAEYGLVGQD